MHDRRLRGASARLHRGWRTAAACQLFLLALLAWAAPALAQQRPEVAALDAYIERARTGWNVPGLAVAIVKDGEVVLAKGYGVREVGGSARVDEHTLFAIASNTKAFTAAALATLVDAGKLSWDDRVQQHLPWFRLYDPYVSADARVRDLLSHRIGLGTYSNDLVWYGTPYSAEEVVRRARFIDQAFPFRGGYGYSNIMFIAAGEIIPAVTGKSWTEYVKETILDPIGMHRTVLSTRQLQGLDNVATPHGLHRGKLVAFPWQNWDAMAAAGGIISSVSDMSRWLLLQLGRGQLDGRRIFSEEAAHEMWSLHTPQPVTRAAEQRTPSTHFRGYGLGWVLNDYLGRKIISHGGGYDGMFSRTVLVPEENLGIVVLTNGMTSLATAITNRILDTYLGGQPRDWAAEMLTQQRAADRRFAERIEKAITPTARGTKPSLPLQAYTGTYFDPFYGEATVTLENGRLVFRMLPNPELVADLTHLQYETFVIEWRRRWPWFDRGTLSFVLDATGTPTRIELNVPNDDFWFHELDFRRTEQRANAR